MSITSVAIRFLVGFSALLGVPDLPAGSRELWNVVTPWTWDGNQSVFEASSVDLVAQCQENKGAKIHFPMVVHAAHEISIDGVPVLKFGDETFTHVRSFYGSPTLPCHHVIKARAISWKVTCYSRYFSRFSHFPNLVDGAVPENLWSETLNVIAAGTLIVLAIIIVAIFRGKVPNTLTYSLAFSNLAYAVYFANSVAGFFGFPFSMLTAHKLADVGIWIGELLYFNALRAFGLCTPTLFWVYAGNVSIALLFIVFGPSGDVVQMGTTIPFIFTPILFLTSGWRLYNKMSKNNYERQSVFAFLSLAFFFALSLNDMVVVMGLASGQMVLSLGFIAGVLFFALSVNEQISTVYKERDYLNGNLETEVARKTIELRGKTAALEMAMLELKTTQAELVHSAKLASLGTLSAGIAHEINNSMNYVYGSLKPLEAIIDKSTGMADAPKEKAKKLLMVMGDGLRLTFEIIKSLRNFTGLNQAKMNDIDLKEVIDTVLTILRNRTKNQVTVHVDVPAAVHVYGSVVGLNQVFMNLVGNSVDAMPQGGDLWIKAHSLDKNVVIEVRDSGGGIPSDALARIFEPFFTTKEVGKGTGLGLHIVRQEIEKHHGEIRCESETGKGTTFFITLPLSHEAFLKEAA